MTQYRRRNQRQFFKIYDDKRICCVLIMQDWAVIEFGLNKFKYNDLVEDEYQTTKECTEEEFNKAYKAAFDSITLQRID